MSSQSNDIPEGFKMTEIGPLPDEWKTAKLEDIASFTSKPRELDISSCVAVPFIPMEAITSDGSGNFRYNIKPVKEISSGVYCERGDLLLAKITPCLENGKQCLLGPDDLPSSFAYTTTEVYPLKISQNTADIRFLFYYLLYPPVRRELASKMEGTTGRQRLPKHVVRNTVIPVPPLPEQKAIARLLSTIQKAIEAQDKIIAAARELKKSLIHHLFTYGPVPVSEAEQVPLKETEIGPVPEHWDLVRLEEVTLKTKQVDPRREPACVFKYVDVSGISREQLKIIDFTEYRGEEAPHRARKLVRTGDIIFATVRPYLKRMAIVPDEFDGQIVSTAFCVIRCRHDSTEPNYVFQAVTKDDFVQRVSEHQRGSSYPAVTDKDILTQMIPLPSIQEQEEVAPILSGVDSKIESEENRKSALQALFKTMLHQLMTGKVRVKDLEVTAA